MKKSFIISLLLAICCGVFAQTEDNPQKIEVGANEISLDGRTGYYYCTYTAGESDAYMLLDFDANSSIQVKDAKTQKFLSTTMVGTKPAFVANKNTDYLVNISCSDKSISTLHFNLEEQAFNADDAVDVESALVLGHEQILVPTHLDLSTYKSLSYCKFTAEADGMALIYCTGYSSGVSIMEGAEGEAVDYTLTRDPDSGAYYAKVEVKAGTTYYVIFKYESTLKSRLPDHYL